MFNGFRCKCLNTLCVSKCYKQPFTYVECNITLKQEEMGVTKNPSAVAKHNNSIYNTSSTESCVGSVVFYLLQC